MDGKMDLGVNGLIGWLVHGLIDRWIDKSIDLLID